MPKNIPSLKPKELIKLLEKAGCSFHREGKLEEQTIMVYRVKHRSQAYQ